MKTLRFLLIAAGFLVLVPSTVAAQCIGAAAVCITRTTLSADVSSTATVISVTSATGFTVGNGVWIDFELMDITSITGTSISVNRGQRGTRAMAHDNGDGVFTGVDAGGPLGAGHFNVSDPDFGQDCTRGAGQATHLPWINIRTGWMWTCDYNGADWTATVKSPLSLNSEPAAF